MYSHTKNSFERRKPIQIDFVMDFKKSNVSFSLIALIHHGTFFMDVGIQRSAHRNRPRDNYKIKMT